MDHCVVAKLTDGEFRALECIIEGWIDESMLYGDVSYQDAIDLFSKLGLDKKYGEQVSSTLQDIQNGRLGVGR